MAATATPTSSPARSICFEALDDVKKHYPIDDDRLVMRGFSMGGAACWQFAVHYPSMWAAAAPGAGFSETADFLKVFQKEKVQPTWYEQKLWHLYDCTDYAINLFNCPTVAYSGEIDRQKQAADMMAEALKEEGIELVHLIGAKAGHQYTPEAKAEINRRIDSIVEPAATLVPTQVRFTTWTLRYNRCVLGAGRRTGAALGAGARRRRVVDAGPGRTGDRPRDQDEERLRPDAGQSPGLQPAGTSREDAEGDDRRRERGITASRSPTAPGRPISARSTASGSRSSRPTTAPCASGTACKGRSTTPSWTAS